MSVISDEVKTKLRRLMDARVQRDESKQKYDEDEREFREIEAEVYDLFTGEDEDDLDGEGGIKGTLKVPLGEPYGTVAFRTRKTPYGRVIPGKEEELLGYLEQRAMVDEFTQPKFSKKRLNEMARDADEQGIELPPGMDYYFNRGITITRQKG